MIKIRFLFGGGGGRSRSGADFQYPGFEALSDYIHPLPSKCTSLSSRFDLSCRTPTTLVITYTLIFCFSRGTWSLHTWFSHWSKMNRYDQWSLSIKFLTFFREIKSHNHGSIYITKIILVWKLFSKININNNKKS